jgi:flagellar hook-associated protein 2
MSISSLGIGSGLDIKNIVSQLVALERQPLEKLKIEATTTQAKVSTFGQIKSLASTLSDNAGKLASVTGWNTVKATSSDAEKLAVSAIGGTQPTSFEVEVQSLAKSQATHSMAILPVGDPVGSGTLKIEMGKWSGKVFHPGDEGSLEFEVLATDTVTDVASRINGEDIGVTATVLTDDSGDRLLLRGKELGADSGFRMSVVKDRDTKVNDAQGLSRLVQGTVVDQVAQDALATINGIAVSSSTNAFANKVTGVTFTALKETAGPVTIAIERDTAAVQANVQAFVESFNAVNAILNEATKYDAASKAAGMLQGDGTTLAFQSNLRTAVQSVRKSSEVYSRFNDIGVEMLQGGNLQVNGPKLEAAMQNMPELKAFFTNSGLGDQKGMALYLKGVITDTLNSDGFFATKDASLKRSLTANATEQTRVNAKAARVEAELNRKYSALDAQMNKLNGLNNYVTQQIAQWNKHSS